MTDKKDPSQIMEEELQRRLDCYCSDCKPGNEYGPIKPMGFKQFLPALIISIILTIYLIVAMVAFPSFHPG